jgi:hypothetical protein
VKSEHSKKHAGKFKGGRFRVGDKAIRVVGEESFTRQQECKVVKITKKHIVCELLVASSRINGNLFQKIVFNKKTGINELGLYYGWLESPLKRTLPDNVEKICANQNSNETIDFVLYNYCL